MDQLSKTTEKGPIKWLALFLQIVAAITLLSLMLITCIDVLGRYIFNNPLTGSIELTEIAVGIVVFSVLPIISWRNDHVVVDLMDSFFSPFMHFIRTSIINILISIAFFFIGQRSMVLAERAIDFEEASEYLEIPSGYMMYFISYICWATAIMVVTLGIYRAYCEYRQSLSKTTTQGAT